MLTARRAQVHLQIEQDQNTPCLEHQQAQQHSPGALCGHRHGMRRGVRPTRRGSAVHSIGRPDNPSQRVHPAGDAQHQQSQQQQQQQQRSGQPVLQLASAVDSVKKAGSGIAHKAVKGQGEELMVDGVPAWRIALGNVAAGATAGCAVEAALYPLDTIKTRLQLMIKGQGSLASIFKSGGARNLYAGVWSNLAGVAPASAVFMGIYEPVKAHIKERVAPERSFLAPLGAGGAAGMVASVIRVPTEVVKQRLQSGEFTQGAVRAVQSIVRQEGVRGLFAGYGSFLIRDLPFDAIEFVAYDQLKKAYSVSVGRREEDIRGHETAVIGAIAGALTGIVTTPLDVIKTRLMTQGSKQAYSGVIDCARKVARDEGMGTFLQGWQPRVIWIGLGGCVFFTALEEAKKLYAPKALKQ